MEVIVAHVDQCTHPPVAGAHLKVADANTHIVIVGDTTKIARLGRERLHQVCRGDPAVFAGA